MLHFDHFVDFFRHLDAHARDDKFLYIKNSSEWQGISYAEFCNQVKYLTLGLKDLGLDPSQKIGIISPSIPRWYIADLSILFQRTPNVPMYHNSSEERFLFEVEQAEIKTIFAASTDSWELIRNNRHLFDTVVAMDEAPADIDAVTWEEMIVKGKKIFEETPERFELMLDAVQPDDVASILYTSGTTGEPKGAVHTHKSLIQIVTYDKIGWNNSDVYLNILPSAHILGRMFNYCIIFHGITSYYLTDVLQFRHTCQEVKPSIVCAVPRLLEKVYNTLVTKIDHASPLKKMLGKAAIALAHSKTDNFITKLLFPIFDKLVYSKIRDVFGGRMANIHCGGANLDPALESFYDRVGIPINIGWGMTEVGTIALTYHAAKKVGTVGPCAVNNVEITISDDHEVLVRGITVMKEYYKNPEATQQAFDKEGWFHTGDRGNLDDDGYLTIERRIKELYKTSSGEYIAPITIETQLQRHPLIEVAAVIGDGRKFATVLCFPDFEAVKEWKKRHNREDVSDEEFLQSELVRSKVSQYIAKLNEHLDIWEQIHAFTFIQEKASIKGGQLTPTMKLRRYNITKKYSREIDELYHNSKNALKRE